MDYICDRPVFGKCPQEGCTERVVRPCGGALTYGATATVLGGATELHLVCTGCGAVSINASRLIGIVPSLAAAAPKMGLTVNGDFTHHLPTH